MVRVRSWGIRHVCESPHKDKSTKMSVCVCMITFEDNEMFSRDSNLLTLDSWRGNNIQDCADWELKDKKSVKIFLKPPQHVLQALGYLHNPG